MVRILAITAALLAVLGCAAALGVFQNNTYVVEGRNLLMSGEITTRTPDRFIAMIEENPQIETVVLMDMPGSVDEVAVHDIGYFIREEGLNTHLTPQSEIYSGAVDLFLAGNQRTMTCCAVIGVHDWSDAFGAGSEYARNSGEHDANVAYFEDMLGSDAFYWFTLKAATPEEMHVMTRAEIAQFDVLTAPIDN